MEKLSFKFVGGTKAYVFDLDGTICFTKTGRPPFRPRDETDFIIPPKIVQHLVAISEKGNPIVIVTNQSNYQSSEIVQQRMRNIFNFLTEKIDNFIFYILYGKNIKKPSISFYEDLIKIGLEPEKVIMSGDACSSFSEDPDYQWSDSDYQCFLNLPLRNKVFKLPPKYCPGTSSKMIILMGNPGSGKSTFAEDMEREGWNVVSSDRKMTLKKQISLAKEFLESGEGVVIDNTNGTSKSRQPFIDLAVELNVSSRLIWFLRDGRARNRLRQKPVPEIAFNVYSKNFEEPDKSDIRISYCY